MAKTVDLIKEILSAEESSVGKYEEALGLMAHPSSKDSIQKIVHDKKGHISALKKIIELSHQCPAVQ